MRVLLEVIGTQYMDGLKDTIELTTIGELRQTQQEYIVTYQEEQEPPYGAIDVSVTINKNEEVVEMVRTASTHGSRLLIESSARNLCQYETEFGNLLMGISGYSIDIDDRGDEGCFTFYYDIDMNGALTSKNSVKILYKSNQEK